jgi:hypothetical protein
MAVVPPHSCGPNCCYRSSRCTNPFAPVLRIAHCGSAGIGCLLVLVKINSKALKFIEGLSIRCDHCVLVVAYSSPVHECLDRPVTVKLQVSRIFQLTMLSPFFKA